MKVKDTISLDKNHIKTRRIRDIPISSGRYWDNEFLDSDPLNVC